MCEVVRSNFEQLLPQILERMDKSTFIAIDAEFTGLKDALTHKESLFDNGEDRYSLLKKNIVNFIICQFGLSIYTPVSENSYEAYSYNFYIRPTSLGLSEEWFSLQASCVEFLCEHNFDFNKFLYEGIPYLSEEKESRLKYLLETGCFFTEIGRNHERTLQEYVTRVRDWQVDPENSDPLVIELSRQIAPYLIHIELRQRFPLIWTSDAGPNRILVKKVSKEGREALEKQEGTPEEIYLESVVGFTKVFRHLVKIKKPLIGHNLLTDLMLMYQQFYKPLPKKLKSFKAEIHRLFPVVYDTKHLGFVLRKETNTDLLDANNLEELYNRLDSQKGKYLVLYSPSIKIAEEHPRYRSGNLAHEAGYDAYMAGYVFLRLAHLMKSKKLQQATGMRPLSPKEHMEALHHLCNHVNVIRAQIHHINLAENDPDSVRPRWLVIESSPPKKPLDLTEVTQLIAKFGTFDLRPRTPYQAYIAVGNFRCAKDILSGFKTHPTYRVTPYSLLLHAPLVRPLLWTGAIISTGSCVWFLAKIWKQIQNELK